MKTDKYIVLYTMDGCPYCDMMKDQLNELNIPFIERDIEIEEKEYDMFVQVVGGNDYVPAFMIIETNGKKHNTKFFAPERDFNEIVDGVKIIKEEYGKKTNV